MSGIRGKDFAEECALNWMDRWHDDKTIDYQAAIEGAVREALWKAREVAAESLTSGDGVIAERICDDILALGVRKP